MKLCWVLLFVSFLALDKSVAGDGAGDTEHQSISKGCMPNFISKFHTEAFQDETYKNDVFAAWKTNLNEIFATIDVETIPDLEKVFRQDIEGINQGDTYNLSNKNSIRIVRKFNGKTTRAKYNVNGFVTEMNKCIESFKNMIAAQQGENQEIPCGGTVWNDSMTKRYEQNVTDKLSACSRTMKILKTELDRKLRNAVTSVGEYKQELVKFYNLLSTTRWSDVEEPLDGVHKKANEASKYLEGADYDRQQIVTLRKDLCSYLSKKEITKRT